MKTRPYNIVQGNIVQGWWWRRFHPLTRVGWRTVTSGMTRSTIQTVVGIGLIGAGLILGRRGHRTLLYRGDIEPGLSTRIRVYRGDRVMHDGPFGD